MDVVKEHSLSVYASDTAIRSRTDLTQGQRATTLMDNLVGGGGTDMTRAIEELDDPRRRRAEGVRGRGRTSRGQLLEHEGRNCCHPADQELLQPIGPDPEAASLGGE